jgi:hypothetical protein
MTFNVYHEDFTQPLRRGTQIATFTISNKLTKLQKREVRDYFWLIKDYLQKIENKNLIIKITE